VEGVEGWREAGRGLDDMEGPRTGVEPRQVHGRGRMTDELAHDQEDATANPIRGREKSEDREKG
jgi:hypothetical protein